MPNQVYVIMDNTTEDWAIPAGAYVNEKVAIAELQLLRDGCADAHRTDTHYWLETVQVYG